MTFWSLITQRNHWQLESLNWVVRAGRDQDIISPICLISPEGETEAQNCSVTWSRLTKWFLWLKGNLNLKAGFLTLLLWLFCFCLTAKMLGGQRGSFKSYSDDLEESCVPRESLYLWETSLSDSLTSATVDGVCVCVCVTIIHRPWVCSITSSKLGVFRLAQAHR